MIPAKELLARLEAFAKDPALKLQKGEPTLSDLLDQIANDERIEENTLYLTKALPILRPMFDGRLNDAKISENAAEEAVKMLGVMVSYAADEDLARLEAALKKSFAVKANWADIFGQFHSGNENAPKLIAVFQKSFPSEPLAAQALRVFNALLVDGDLKAHPFDCPPGIEQLRKWLAADGEEPFNATVACAFLKEAPRKELLAIAKKSKDVSVQMEAAWAAAKAGDASGFEELAAFAKALNTSHRACGYLDELNRRDAIPKEALEPSFAARAEVVEWFSHPAEMSRPPDEATILDSRELNWPPTGDKRRLWAVKGVFKPQSADEKEEVHVALTGSSTFCLFGRTTATMTPEQILLLHCHWEMETEGDNGEIPIQKALEALQKANPGMFDKVTIPPPPKPEDSEAEEASEKKAGEKAAQ